MTRTSLTSWHRFAARSNNGPTAAKPATAAAAEAARWAYANVIEALKAGTVDAIFTKGARGLQAAVDQGLHIVYDIRQHPDLRVRSNNGAPRPITVDAGLLQEHPDLVDRFLLQIVGIGEWAASHPAETCGLHRTGIGLPTDDWVRQAYGADIHLRQGTDLNSRSIAALEGTKTSCCKPDSSRTTLM